MSLAGTVAAAFFIAYFLGLGFEAAVALCGLCGVCNILWSVAAARSRVSSSEY
jgi:hypothetical protein